MSSTTSVQTILALREIFSRFGLPHQLVSDNGPQFSSEEFERFLSSNGVKHLPTVPYHPASNGEAKRFVQTVKQALRAGLPKGVPLSMHWHPSFNTGLLHMALLEYHLVPCSLAEAFECV